MAANAMVLLRHRVPLTLLIDLATGDGVDSGEILEHEPCDAAWLGAEPYPADEMSPRVVPS